MKRNWIYKAQAGIDINTHKPYKYEVHVRADNKKDAILKGRKMAQRTFGMLIFKGESVILQESN